MCNDEELKGLSFEDLKKTYETSNAEVIRENGLIHARMNMFLTSQAFLLAAMGLAASFQEIAIIIIWVGIISSLSTVISIASAIYVFLRFFKINKSLISCLMEHDKHSYAERYYYEIWTGFSAPIAIPIALLIAWLYLLIGVDFPLQIING